MGPIPVTQGARLGRWPPQKPLPQLRTEHRSSSKILLSWLSLGSPNVGFFDATAGAETRRSGVALAGRRNPEMLLDQSWLWRLST